MLTTDGVDDSQIIVTSKVLPVQIKLVRGWLSDANTGRENFLTRALMLVGNVPQDGAAIIAEQTWRLLRRVGLLAMNILGGKVRLRAEEPKLSSAPWIGSEELEGNEIQK